MNADLIDSLTAVWDFWAWALSPLWSNLRLVNVAVAGLVVILFGLQMVRNWHTYPRRFKRTMPWVLSTYVVIAYGSGEAAADPHPISPGLRVALLLAVMAGLVVALLLNVHDDEPNRTDRP